MPKDKIKIIILASIVGMILAFKNTIIVGMIIAWCDDWHDSCIDLLQLLLNLLP
jgi:hypothetical protein